MLIHREIVVSKLADYLSHQISLPELVDWAESAMMEADFDTVDPADLVSIVAQIGLADVRSYGLNWEDCEQMLDKLGYRACVEIVAK